MPLYQAFTNGQRMVVAQVDETSLLHWQQQGFKPTSLAQEFPTWLAAKEHFLGAASLSDVQQRMIALARHPDRLAQLVRNEFDLWKDKE